MFCFYKVIGLQEMTLPLKEPGFGPLMKQTLSKVFFFIYFYYYYYTIHVHICNYYMSFYTF